MKFALDCYQYLNNKDFRVLHSIEIGHRNAKLVPYSVLLNIVRETKTISKSLEILTRNKLIYHDCKMHNSYKLTQLGYDFLAIKALIHRRVAFSFGNISGVGKESDILEVAGKRNETLILKLYRLGRASFRSIKNKRDYMTFRACNVWNSISRKSALKEHSFMRALHNYGFPIPYPIESNRHALLMRKVVGIQLAKSGKFKESDVILTQCLELMLKMATIGLVHCDFSEYNLIISNRGKVIIIDFPQMISITHPTAKLLFQRDLMSILSFFGKSALSTCSVTKYKYKCNITSILSIYDKVFGILGSLDTQLPTIQYY